MSIHTLQDLAYAYAVADPVRDMLFALQDRIDTLEAQRKPLSDAEVSKAFANRKVGLSVFGCFLAGLRHAEAAHGIKEGT